MKIRVEHCTRVLIGIEIRLHVHSSLTIHHFNLHLALLCSFLSPFLTQRTNLIWYILSFSLTPLSLHTDALVKRLLPLGFSRAEIRRQLYLSSNSVTMAANRLLDREREGGEEMDGAGKEEREGEEEEEEGGVRREEVDEEKKGKSFSISQIEVIIYYSASVVVSYYGVHTLWSLVY